MLRFVSILEHHKLPLKMSFELIYKEIGDIGRYQIFVLFLGWMSLVYGGFVWINSVFLLYVPDHRYMLL